MALYLGNQKVSLRSGQDPTFDYGFDSNGRLVFANKNATEINNFLNYDSSYSEVLDLSNLSKMEKVAVNGTVDRKMEGLKGLLVSQNAPFTGSSPQINASYTGLSKSALVSLFESAPYNVGYTKVGNPTIVDGVASGFSVGNYLRATRPLGSANLQSCDIRIKCKTGDAIIDNMPLLYCSGSPYWFAVRVNREKMQLLTRNAKNTGYMEVKSSINIQASMGYIIEATITTNKQTLKLYTWDGELLSNNFLSVDGGVYFNADLTGKMLVGSSINVSWPGSIDLNETYIKVNGVPWFGPGATKNLVPDGTVVGDVTIKDGVASGFSGSKYISVPNFSTASPLEMVIRTKYNTFTSGVRYLFSFAGLYILQDSANTIYCSVQKSDGTLVYPSFQNLVADTFYCLKLVYDGTTLWAGRSTDGTNYTEIYNQPLSLYSRTGTARLGYRNSDTTVWDGSIDLNNTYIKSGGTYIYRGMVPMTKTCSIVGATGTADLTQEDKNIILNKGWNLTVQ